MKGSSNDNGKISDSGYTNTCVSQSQRSSGSSLSRNSNRSESSGYCGGPAFNSRCYMRKETRKRYRKKRQSHSFNVIWHSSNYALPQPINKRKDKEHKKKKSKAMATTSLANIDEKLGSQINLHKQKDLGAYDSNGSSSDFTSHGKKSEEVAGVELVGGTGLGEHNGDSNSTEPDGGVGTNTNPLDDTTSNTNVGFCAVISMKKGLVISTTASLKLALGYTRESWISRSFIDFVHPKDKQTFADHLAKNIALPYGDHEKVSGPNGRQTSMFCSLRKQDVARSSTTESASDESNSLVTTANQYLPFHLTTSIKFFRERAIDEKPRMMFLTVIAEPIVPVYKAPEEMIISAIFCTRHDPSCILTHVDVDVVQYFGYMPQNMIGRSLFDFYHPEDLPFMKDVYETVVKMEGSPFRSKPYRFAAQNGDYIVLETEWSSFVNPWREKLEFIVGHHRVLRGPANPNVFQPPDDCQRGLLANISEEIFKESKIIQGEIRALLDEKIQRSEDNEAYEITSRSNDLDIFVENLLREVKPLTQVSKERLPADSRSFSEHDSVILGAISPHHEYCDSKSSTETPPSYNQLNYNEKITRFFDSKRLVTTTYGSDEDNLNSSVPSNEDAGKMSSNLTGTKDATLSAENLSSGSNNRTSYDRSDDSYNPRSANTMPTESLKLPMLTESVLNKHNQEMEKLLVQQHKERRCNIKNNNKHQKDSRLKGTKDKTNKHDKGQTKNRGSKRRSSHEREAEQSKISKYDENVETCTAAPLPVMTNTPMNVDDNSTPQSRQSTNVWPSLAVTVPSQPAPHFCMATQNSGTHEASKCPGYSPFLPIYYVPLPRIREDLVQTMIPPVLDQSFENCQTQQNTRVSYAAAPLAGVIYPPMVCTPAPVTTMYRPFVMPGPAPIHRETPQSHCGVTQLENSSDRKRPGSQATSVKAEPGSTMAMSESSKKLFSSGEHFSSCVSIDGGCSSFVPNTKLETNTNSQFESSMDDSSDSSFYGSFLTTSNGSSLNINPKIVAPQALRKPTVDPPMNEAKKQLNTLRNGPPWQEGPKITDELIYQYQLAPKPLNEVLEADMKALKTLKQPQMVNDQLAQLYLDMKLDGFVGKLVLGDRDASSDSESGSSGDNPRNIIPEVKNCESKCSIRTEASPPAAS